MARKTYTREFKLQAVRMMTTTSSYCPGTASSAA